MSASIGSCALLILFLGLVALAICAGADAGPIVVQALLPGPTSASSGPVPLRNRDAITAVFSSAVIALGADWGTELPAHLIPFSFEGAQVPGKMRWVTTSIARFDPVIDWPSDLAFTVSVNALSSFDNRTVQPVSQEYVTLAQRVSIADVMSERAHNLTNGEWSSSLTHLMPDGSYVSSFEVPPDGQIRLSFHYPINESLAGAALKIFKSGSKDEIPFTYSSCTSALSPKHHLSFPAMENDADVTCLLIAPDELEVDTKYDLVLPKGSRTFQFAGPTQSDMTESFYGLYSFVFPFLRDNNEVRSRLLTLYLRHGLEDDTMVDDLSASFSLSPALPLIVRRVSNATIEIAVELETRDTYTLSVRGSELVRDGFGLPLRSVNYTFTTSAPASVLAYASGDFPIFESFSGELVYFYRDLNTWPCQSESAHVDVASIGVDDVPNLIASLNNYGVSFVNATKYILTHYGDKLQRFSIATEELLGESGLMLEEVWYYCSGEERTKTSNVISTSNIGTTVLSSDSAVNVWVTQLQSNQVVAGAKVSLYGYSHYYYPLKPHNVERFCSGATNEDGLFACVSDAQWMTVYALVETDDGKLHLSSPFHLGAAYKPSGPTVVSEIITDRGFHAPGEPIYMKGYIRYKDMLTGELTKPPYSEAVLRISWDDSDDSEREYNVDVSENGSFHTEVRVPLNATFGHNSFSLETRFGEYLASASILIADPRIPTTNMTLTASHDIYRPNTTVKLILNVGTYTGEGLANAPVTLRWELSRARPYYMMESYFYGLNAWLSPPSNPLPDESGELVVETDDSGLVEVELNISDLVENAVELGNTLTFKAEFLSPTKELLDAETPALSVAYSPLTLSLKPSVTGTLLPEQPFTVFVSVLDVTQDGDLVPDQTVNLALYEFAGSTPPIDLTTGHLAMPSAPIQECTLTTTMAEEMSPCEFTLPALGKYALVGTVIDTDGYTVSTVLPLGQSLEEWEKAPLATLSDIAFVADKTSYEVGDMAVLTFINPFESSLLLVRWGNDLLDLTTSKLVPGSLGLSNVTIPVTESCLGGTSATIVLTAPRGETVKVPALLPLSVLFDPNMPVAIVHTTHLNVPEHPKMLNVAVTIDAAVAAPGGTAGLSVELTDGQGMAVQGEITVFVVNKAALDLTPHPLSSYADVLVGRWHSSHVDTLDSRQRLALEQGYNASMEVVERRLNENPWLSHEWIFHPNKYDVSDVDLTDEAFFTQFSRPLTFFPHTFFHGFRGDRNGRVMMKGMEMGVAADVEESSVMMKGDADGTVSAQLGDGGAAAPEASQGVALRTNFASTAFFLGAMQTDTNGHVHVSYSLPDSIGSYEVRVYAMSSDDAFGSGTAEQTAMRELSLQPSAPRVVRDGDHFLTGVTVTVHDAEFRGEVEVEVKYVCQLLELQDSSVQIVNITRPGPHVVSFAFFALGTGDAHLRYSARVKETLMDAALYPQTIYGQQEPVLVATSFAVDADKNGKEDLSLPPAVPFSGHLSITAGVGRLPAVRVLAERAIEDAQNLRPSSSSILAAMSAKLVLDRYKNSVEGSADAFASAFALLPSYTDSRYGLQFFVPTFFNQFPTTSVRLQIFGIWTLQQASSVALSAEQDSTRQVLMATWTAALEAQIVSEAEQAREQGWRYSQLDNLALVYLTLGTDWSPSRASEEVMADLSLDRLLNETHTAVSKSAALWALVRGDVREEEQQRLRQELLNTMRTQGRSAYVTDPSSQQPSILGSALALSAFVARDEDLVLVEKLANFNAMAEDDSARRYSGEQLHHVMLTLANYDMSRQNTVPNLQLTVSAIEQTLLSAKFTPEKNEPAEASYRYEELKDEGVPITFTAEGTGEASVVLSARFVPVTVETNPIYRGIEVRKVIQTYNPSTQLASGPPLNAGKIGDIVLVTVEVTIPDYAASLVIVDPVAGAFEALDENIYSTDAPSPSPRRNYWSWYLLGAFHQKEFLPDRVIFYGTNIWAGTHSVSYVAIVNAEGEFVLPPALAYDGFQPELMGLSAGGRFTTRDMADRRLIEETPVATPTPTPSGGRGNNGRRENWPETIVNSDTLDGILDNIGSWFRKHSLKRGLTIQGPQCLPWKDRKLNLDLLNSQQSNFNDDGQVVMQDDVKANARDTDSYGNTVGDGLQDEQILGLAISIPLAVIVVAAIAVGIYFFVARRKRTPLAE